MYAINYKITYFNVGFIKPTRGKCCRENWIMTKISENKQKNVAMCRIWEYGATCDLPWWGVSRLIGFLGISRRCFDSRCGSNRLSVTSERALWDVSCTFFDRIVLHLCPFSNHEFSSFLSFCRRVGKGKVVGSVSAWINPKFTHPVVVATGVESSSGEGTKRP